jgi:ribosomal protein S12 methylthiotransferase accessory factor
VQFQHRPPSRPGETLVKARRLVSEETGIIRLVHEPPIAGDGPRIFGCGSLYNEHGSPGFVSDNTMCGSTALDRDQAIVGAIGEAVERYSAAFVPYDDIVMASAHALGPDAIPPVSFVLYSEEQRGRPGFGYRNVGADDVIGWVEGYSLTRERPVFVPAFAVYQPYVSRSGEAPAIQQVTTGLACGNTPEEAILAAICEVVERDAAMLMWLQKRRPPIVTLGEELPPDVTRALRRFGRAARHVTLLDITSDIAIPAYVAVWEGPIGSAHGALFASCAKLDPDRAAAGAIVELAQCLLWAASLIDADTPLPDPATTPLRLIEEHVMWPMRPGAHDAYGFALSSPRRVGFGSAAVPADPLAAVRTCTDRIAVAGLETIVVDVTSPDIREAGLYVFRALVPGAQPLFFGTGLERISERSVSASYSDRAGSVLNLHPHPYP